MPDPAPPQPALYTDVFEVTLSAFGASFRFGARGAVTTVTDPATRQQVQQQAVELHSRMYTSLEHLKIMTFVMARDVLRHERTMGLEIKLPTDVIKQTASSPEEWKQFWYGWKDKQPFGPSTIKALPEPKPEAVNGAEEAEFPFPVKG